MANDQIPISVVYALADRQYVVKLSVPQGTTVAQAIARAKVLERFPDLSTAPLNCAIYGRIVALTRTVVATDRIEILRPLIIDPKENRRQVAAKNKAKAR
jgi:putative ubiquitin-RnfH superfamily antitoxin RatB of RatAB toxin-antitoxin module